MRLPGGRTLLQPRPLAQKSVNCASDSVPAAAATPSDGHRVLTESPLVLTDVETGDGACGQSIIFTYARVAFKATGDLIHTLGALS